MNNHTCVTERLWDMRECAFIDGCYACLVPPQTLLSDVRYIHISPAQQRRIDVAMSKGYQVVTDGSDVFVVKEERVLRLFVVRTDEEWYGPQV